MAALMQHLVVEPLSRSSLGFADVASAARASTPSARRCRPSVAGRLTLCLTLCVAVRVHPGFSLDGVCLVFVINHFPLRRLKN